MIATTTPKRLCDSVDTLRNQSSGFWIDQFHARCIEAPGHKCLRISFCSLCGLCFAFLSVAGVCCVSGASAVVKSVSNTFRTSADDTWGAFASLAGCLVAQCSATPATVAATPPCSATLFQTQISVRHLPGMPVRHSGGGGQGATPKLLGGVARHRCYTCKTL